jgi:Protein of unknown function (DUF1566)
MKKLSFFISLLLLFSSALFAQIGINTDNSLPDPSAGLDVNFTNKGFLPPRVALTAINSADPITAPAIGLFVYNTTNAGTPPNNVTTGYYCWSGTQWIPVLAPQGTNIGDMQYWNGTTWVIVSAGSHGQQLYFCNGVPTWGGCTPVLTTTTVTNILLITATSGGNITSDGGANVTDRGVCWSTSSNPTTTDSRTTDGIGTGIFVSNLTGLTANTLYYVRAYATNSVGTAYGNEITFTTLLNPILPIVTTTPIYYTSPNTVTSGGNVTSDGGATVTARGVCWSISANPTTADSHTTDGNGTGTFTSIITGLTSNTTYYIRAYATNSAGTFYGNEISFIASQFFIGQSYGGGIIFYIDGTGLHGLISATSDQSTGTPWGCMGTLIGGTGTAIGTGQANTTLIVNGCSTAGIAARICDDLVMNGYSDWFLPSKDELNLLYQQIAVVGGFANWYYWSSSEYNATGAWYQSFSSGIQYSYDVKYDTYCVRAVRAF